VIADGFGTYSNYSETYMGTRGKIGSGKILRTCSPLSFCQNLSLADKSISVKAETTQSGRTVEAAGTEDQIQRYRERERERERERQDRYKKVHRLVRRNSDFLIKT